MTNPESVEHRIILHYNAREADWWQIRHFSGGRAFLEQMEIRR